ncbi:GDP-mannose-dependent alpha-(1-6)-phosphatidylinositol dimannoside mannosyltransferase [Streptomyces cinereoruber]|uniref:GDP-mannose-dependent alpha-(1-6)-phosphatidylinositol dimannoside mannosyltransferase n=1 Tax=Streptomyces cinereoruber TaxID=67260 RepID=A0AAV4KLY4_9ACTN|nr:glycosyltransferase [Streptomyces cinereoruber]MBB4159532.1 alpha-1,6-mannosyltransferase [Streptomyces cinereoruber]NIH64008.1 alpha-1,6-mannosyltransferase [Streptomyces cinereoruber]GGR31131.1 GDP-mannose-dependent alpha-(1-6)-phosphatidylinositol dimannoside mannosyltransferase [Streptomyces cinereoruber]
MAVRTRTDTGTGARTGGPDGRGGLRIVRLANFVTPTSGGLRTALDRLGRGYLAAGHEPVLVVPGATASDRRTEQGRIVTLPGPVLPGTCGYRVLADRRRVARLLDELAPDRIEVSDRTTLRWTGEWARRARVPSVMVSHETADGVLRTWGVPPALAARAADRLNRRTAWAFARIVCTTEWAEREFVRIGARNVVRAPLGVDLDHCRPDRRDAALRARYAAGERVLLLLCSRLSVEKRPGTALDALEELRAAGVAAALVVAGDGPLRGALERRARERRLPVRFAGHLADREALADLQAAADVCLAPGPAETFGLSALEALACGTPVVVSASSALPEVVGTAGVAAADTPAAFASGVQSLLAVPETVRRRAARARAEGFAWDRSVAAFLHAHDALPGPEVLVSGVPGDPGASGVPGVPGASGAFGASGVLGALGAPGASGVLGTPGAPEAPGVPGVPGAPEVLGVPGAFVPEEPRR